MYRSFENGKKRRKRDSLIKEIVLLFAVCVISIAAVTVLSADVALRIYARSNVFTVVIDAGHGGKDKGASSKSGTSERDINLAIANALAREFEAHQVAVVMTRQTEDSLASPFSLNKKKDDMNKRRQIIERVKPDLVISIHLNNFPSDTSVRGLQCFYDKSGELSQKYATAVQTEFNKSGLDINRKAKTGDYYILDCTEYPSILVECGFLSNPAEEGLLKTPEYQHILAYYIASAVVKTQLNINANIV